MKKLWGNRSMIVFVICLMIGIYHLAKAIMTFVFLALELVFDWVDRVLSKREKQEDDDDWIDFDKVIYRERN